MPISLSNSSSLIEAVPPSSYILPNTVDVLDPLSSPSFLRGELNSKQAQQNGWIKLTLASVDSDPETRETFEAALYGLYRRDGGSRSVSPQPNQLYLVDENSGRVVGQLEGGANLKEDEAVASGRMQDASTAAAGGRGTDIDGHEAVVIDSLIPAASGAGAEGQAGTITHSVKPISAYTPAANPSNSSIINVANTVSHGIVVGSELLSRAFERGAGKYVASRPAMQTPLVFKDSTRGAFEKGSRWTQQASVYSGKAAGSVANLAGKLGEQIGKATGVQSGPGGEAPKGWKAAVASTLVAVNTVADHLETGGKALVDSGTKSASQVIHHKYGAEARHVADNVGSSVKHVALVYVDARGVGRRALIQAVGKSAIKARMADGSTLYLTNEQRELKQIEDVAAQEQAEREKDDFIGQGGAQGGSSNVGKFGGGAAGEER
ncbi:spg20 protein [Rhodotorula toruloides]|uniref:Spg20 protein n=1 Tax=Rhodotorula toruloides TaxID=5286 RepID=A0A511K8G6_RHOTO|nr:spg20 protein [Rhodotorula toruloides]